MWFSHHALVTQQTVSAALRSRALGPLFHDGERLPPGASAAHAPQLALILLQGALLLAVCTVVHKARPAPCRQTQ